MVGEGQGGAECGAEVRRSAKGTGKGRSDYEIHEAMITRLDSTLRTGLCNTWMGLIVLIFF